MKRKQPPILFPTRHGFTEPINLIGGEPASETLQSSRAATLPTVHSFGRAKQHPQDSLSSHQGLSSFRSQPRSNPASPLFDIGDESPSSTVVPSGQDNLTTKFKGRTKTGSRTSRACLHCRRQKMKCEGADDPPCKRCSSANMECSFERRTDYILNPEDFAWQQRIEERVNQLSQTVEKILAFLGDRGLRVSADVVASQTLPDLQQRPLPPRETSPFRYVLPPPETTFPAPNKSQQHIDIQPGLHRLELQPARHGTRHINQYHEQTQSYPLPSIRQTLNLPPPPGLDNHPQAFPGPFRHDADQDTTPSPPIYRDESLTRPPSNSVDQLASPADPADYASVIDEQQAQEIFRHVQEQYRLQIPIFPFMPIQMHQDLTSNVEVHQMIWRKWCKSLHSFMVDIILCHGSINHPSQRSAKLFGPLLSQAEKNFRKLIQPLNNAEAEEINAVYWTDVRTRRGYELILMMCVATVYLSGPSPPYRFLSPARVVSLLKVPSLANAYGDLHRGVGWDDEVKPLDRYQLYVWLYMIFCQFTHHGIVLPDEIADSTAVQNLRGLLQIPGDLGDDPNNAGLMSRRRILPLFCAHAELLGLQQWSRKKWITGFLGEAQWARETEIEDNLLGGMRNWWIRFEETRSKLDEWQQYWAGAFASWRTHHKAGHNTTTLPENKEDRMHGYLTKMVWMHYEAKRAANFASALFRLTSDIKSSSSSEALYQVALTGVRLSCKLLQGFISESPSSSTSRFPVSSPPKETGKSSQSVFGPEEEDSQIDLYLAICPVSIQRYPIPFAGVLLKAVQLKVCLRAKGVEGLFEDLLVDESFALLERVRASCERAGLGRAHPISPTAAELENMIKIAKRFMCSA